MKEELVPGSPDSTQELLNNWIKRYFRGKLSNAFFVYQRGLLHLQLLSLHCSELFEKW